MDLPGSLIYLSVRAAPYHSGSPCQPIGSLKSWQVTDFAYPGGLVAIHLFNEAELGSLALRLAHSRPQASTLRLPGDTAG